MKLLMIAIVSALLAPSGGAAAESGIDAGVLAGTLAETLAAPGAGGLTVQSIDVLNADQRMLDVVVRSSALSEPVHVAIHLPVGYATGAAKRYPSLYLLHGGGDPLDYALPWPVEGHLAATADASPFHGLVIMPQCGKMCWYVDWAAPSRGGYQPRWETFHIKQLIPWIDANFRTIADRKARAVAGLSMGGYGALKYAARFPSIFSAAGSFSGGTNIEGPGTQQLVIANSVTLVWGAAYTSVSDKRPYLANSVEDVFGRYRSSGWRTQNPFNLVDVYKGFDIRLALYSGNGNGHDPLEHAVGVQNAAFHAKLNSVGVAHRYCRGNGTHDWGYWQNDLSDFLAFLQAAPADTCPNGWGAPGR
jgi:S-formylglutathione hydrolase FrmB